MTLVARPVTQTRNNLGPYLASVRAKKKLSLRDVEEATGKEVSNAYLSQLENGKITKPSPHILHSLAEVYGEDYTILMEKAGYIMKSEKRHSTIPTNAIENLTEEEERALLAYLTILRTQGKR